jgi:acyl carrier protein
MNNAAEKLTQCFKVVFPKLDPEQIPAATAEKMSEWDSVAQVNLLSVIGEEFDIDIDFEEFEGATSFAALLDRLREISARA